MVIVNSPHPFEYEVEIRIRLTLAETTLLKETAARHYDHEVRQCGDCGAINGLHNTAWMLDDATCALEGRPRFRPKSRDLAAGFTQDELREIVGRPGAMAVSWRELDTMRKCLEQAHTDLADKLSEAFLGAMRSIECERGHCDMVAKARAVRGAWRSDG